MTRQRFPNRLADEPSPYLQQHARNPVDWYPWGEEAQARARTSQRPLFVSIGYSACHWCHVMERESFEDPAVAGFLAEHFVAVKVDREERPDVDAVYMDAVQALTGRGGWPLTVFLTPELEPFFGGTYFPPQRRYGMPSFLEVLQAVAEAWEHRPDEVRSQAAQLAAHLREGVPAAGDARPDIARAARLALAELERTHDPRWGGFGSAPKFPTASRLFFLLDRAEEDHGQARAMLVRTLDGMAGGGMWDWLGGGFHRYSVDERWLIPHFEKMLYDNALLARAYGAAGTVLGRPDWLVVARRTADYMIGEMQGDEGGFLSSSDADSEGEEGRFFTWTADEVGDALPAGEAEALIRLCGLEGPPNFEGGRSVLRPEMSPSELAETLGDTPTVVRRRIEQARTSLLAARSRRVPPPTDDKRLAGWNGMAVWSLAYLAAALEEPRYLAAARRSAEFVLARMLRPDGRLVRSWREGRTSGAETLEDVAWVTAGLVELYQSDGEPTWLRAAIHLARARVPFYLDADGVLFDTPGDGQPLPGRPRSPHDGATPANAAVMCEALVRLAALTGSDELASIARRAVAADAQLLARAPAAATSLLAASALADRPPLEVVVVGDPRSEKVRDLVRAVYRSPHRPTVLAVSPSVPVPDELAALVPLFAGRQECSAGTAHAYLCEAGSCRLPTADPAELARALGGMR